MSVSPKSVFVYFWRRVFWLQSEMPCTVPHIGFTIWLIAPRQLPMPKLEDIFFRALDSAHMGWSFLHKCDLLLHTEYLDLVKIYFSQTSAYHIIIVVFMSGIPLLWTWLHIYKLYYRQICKICFSHRLLSFSTGTFCTGDIIDICNTRV